MIKEPSNKIARFELFKLAKLASDSGNDSHFNADQIQKSVRQLVTEHDINIFKKEAKIIIDQNAIDQLPLTNALQVQDTEYFQSLAADVAEQSFSHKPLTRFMEFSDSSSATPNSVSFNVAFPDFPEMHANVASFLGALKTTLNELGVQDNQIKVRTFGCDSDLDSFIERATNGEDRWVYSDKRDLIQFEDKNAADDFLTEFFHSDQNPSEINLGKFIALNKEFEPTFDAWVKKAQAPQLKQESALAM